MAATKQRRIRFLLVEDDEDHAAIVMRSLQRSQIPSEVEHVIDGTAALAFLRQQGEYATRQRPDVVLLDLNLPRLSGHDVLVAIRSVPGLEHLPVVILSTSDAESDRVKAYEQRANSYLVKPLEFAEFRRLVDTLSLYWGVLNRPAPLSAYPS